MEKKDTFFQMFNRIQQASSWPGPCALLVIVYKQPLGRNEPVSALEDMAISQFFSSLKWDLERSAHLVFFDLAALVLFACSRCVAFLTPQPQGTTGPTKGDFPVQIITSLAHWFYYSRC